MNHLLKLQEKFLKIPLGRRIFSWVASNNAPYFHTIKPQIIELRHNYMKASMRKRRAVHNHLKTVHAIASCNLCEFAAGVCMEASIPAHRRWIPVGMKVDYIKKATTDLTATCDLNHVEWDTCKEALCTVSVRDTSDIEVVKAIITMKVSDRPKKG